MGVERPISLKISDAILDRAGRVRGPNPFAVADHPPSVTRNVQIAADETMSEVLGWAATQYMSSAFAEGVTFLGYAYLSELAQRPEYRRISEVIAAEMTRKWITFKSVGDKDKGDKIKKLNDAFARLDVRGAFRKVAEQDGFFGRAHLYVDLGATNDGPELMSPIGDGWNEVSQKKIKRGSLVAIRPVEAVWCYPIDYNSSNPLRPDWYKPSSWTVQGERVHATRLLTFVGREVPDMLKPAYSFGGLSMSQMAKPYVDNWLRTRQSVSDLIHSFSVFGLSTNLDASLQEGGDLLFKRADLFNKLRDNRGMMILDKDSEDFFNVAAPLGTLDVLQAQSQEHMSAVSAIPIVKLLGIQPAGLNASSDGEIRTFYDWIAAYQELLFRKNLHAVLGIVMISELGEVDPDITVDFEPLMELDEKSLADMQKTKADTDNVYLSEGVVSTEEVRKRLVGDPDSPYQGLDAEDLPESPSLKDDGKTDEDDEDDES